MKVVQHQVLIIYLGDINYDIYKFININKLSSCFKLLLIQPQYQIIMKLLVLLYKLAFIFPFKFWEELLKSTILDKEVLLYLFCHWDTEVRQCTHMILIFRTVSGCRSELPCLMDKYLLKIYSSSSFTNCSYDEIGKNIVNMIQDDIYTYKNFI